MRQTRLRDWQPDEKQNQASQGCQTVQPTGTTLFGSVTVVGEGTFLRIDGEDIIGFHLEDGQLQVSLRLYNEADELLLHIERNEWVSGDALPWDIEADWQLMVLRQRARQITISIDARSIPMRVKGEFYRSGRRLPLEEKCISMDHKRGVTLSELAFVGMMLELHLNDGGFSFGPSPNVASGVLISWPNRRERLWQAKEAWRKIKAERTATSRVHGV